MNIIKLLSGAALLAIASAASAHAADKIIAGMVFQQDQFFRTIQIGMEAAAKKEGAELLQANSDNKPEKEQSLVNTYISRKVGAIVIAPLSKAASASALNRANDAGIKVVTYNSTIEGNAPAAFVNASQDDLGGTTGKAAAAFIKEKLGGKANVAILQYKSQVPEQSAARVNGFLNAAKAGADITVVADQDAWLAEKAVSVANDILTAHPEINIIFAANEGGTVGAVQAVRNAGKQGKVFVFGTDGSQQLVNFLQADDNILQAVTAQQPYQIGYAAVEAAVAAIDGKPAEKEVSVPVQGLNRADPEGVKAFGADLKKYK
jgi:simple sugar transport system substrate-binding protein/ribose transport system substrate-binding protein